MRGGRGKRATETLKVSTQLFVSRCPGMEGLVVSVRHHLIGEAVDNQPIRGMEKLLEFRPIPGPKGEESHRGVTVERRIEGQDIETG